MRVFISYKSEDINVAREIVDFFISSGVSVWFAEYEVLPSQYEAFDRNLEANLQNAVSLCTHALVFTNNRWSQSDYCRTEMKAVNAVISAQNIIELRIPHEELPHRDYPILGHGGVLDYAQEPAATAARVLEILGIEGNLSVYAAVPSAKPSFRLWRYGLALNPEPFKASIKESNRAPFVHGTPSIVLQAKLDGQTVQLQIVLAVFDSVLPLQNLQITDEGAAADREVYNGYRQYAQNWEAKTSINICGLHLFFWNKRSQMALTYATQGRDSENPQGSWERRYVISPRGADPAERGEFSFIFYAPDIKGTPEEQFRRFTSFCPLFERIMRTVQFQPITARENLINNIPMVFVRLFYLAICGWGAHALVSKPGVIIWPTLLVMVAGAICADLAVFFYSSIYRQMALVIGKQPIEDSLEGAYSRITINIPSELSSYPVLFVMSYIKDLFGTLGATQGTLRLPGPGLSWLVTIWFLLINYGYSKIGMSWSLVLCFLAAFIVGLIIALRSVCYILHGKNWKDLEL